MFEAIEAILLQVQLINRDSVVGKDEGDKQLSIHNNLQIKRKLHIVNSSPIC